MGNDTYQPRRIALSEFPQKRSVSLSLILDVSSDIRTPIFAPTGAIDISSKLRCVNQTRILSGGGSSHAGSLRVTVQREGVYMSAIESSPPQCGRYRPHTRRYGQSSWLHFPAVQQSAVQRINIFNRSPSSPEAQGLDAGPVHRGTR